MRGEHRELREQLGAYALGQLDGSRWQAVHDHIEVCEVCRADLEEIAPVAGLLGVARDQLRPDELGAVAVYADVPGLSPALLAEVRAAGAGSAGGGTSGGGAAVVPITRRLARGRWLPAVAAAAVLVALAAGAAGFALGSAGRTPAVPLEAVAVRVLDPAVRAQADLVAHTWGLEVKLTATGFAPGATYTVTVTDDAGRTVGAGEFVGTGPDQMRCNLNSSILRADAAMVQVRGVDGQVVLDAAV